MSNACAVLASSQKGMTNVVTVPRREVRSKIINWNGTHQL